MSGWDLIVQGWHPLDGQHVTLPMGYRPDERLQIVCPIRTRRLVTAPTDMLIVVSDDVDGANP